MPSIELIQHKIASNDRLVRFMAQIDSISIIEYYGDKTATSFAIYRLLRDNEIPTDVVTDIVLCGEPSFEIDNNADKLHTLYPTARINKTRNEWQKNHIEELKLSSALVVHAFGPNSASDFDNSLNAGSRFRKNIKATRKAYYLAVFYYEPTLFEEASCEIRAGLSLRDLDCDIEEAPPQPVQNDFCKDKQKFMMNCAQSLPVKEAFFRILEESAHGCQECNQCSRYGSLLQCPMGQTMVAEFYCSGLFVPAAPRIAHQWFIKAARQGYKPAHIRVADNILKGYGCKKSYDDAIEILSTYAKRGDTDCIERLIASVNPNDGYKALAVLPFIVKLANDGDDAMIELLYEAFRDGNYGLPKDEIQQEEWISAGAENGTPWCVKAMAEMREKAEDWAEAYRWYHTLSEIAPDAVTSSHLEEIELKMLTNGSTPHEIALKGMDFLYGYHDSPRDLHLAQRCFRYGRERKEPLATGLLGLMYCDGLIAENESNLKGLMLLNIAAMNDDVISVHKILSLKPHLLNHSGLPWYHRVTVIIDSKVDIGDPIALYVKADYHIKGFAYTASPADGFKLMLQSAAGDFPPAQYQVAKMYQKGIGTTTNDSLYKEWLKRAADNGHYEAEGEYGVMLYADYWRRDSAFKYLRNAIEKGYDNSLAIKYLAQCYTSGYGTAIDKIKAHQAYLKAAEAGDVDSQRVLCEWYYNGSNGVDQSYAEALRWGEAALSQGDKSVRFKIAYSASYTGDKPRALELYSALANEGNALAMNNYGCELSDPIEKAMWFQKAADAGESYGMWNLGRYYRDGTAVERNIDKAIELLSAAADYGCGGAAIDIANMYRYGTGVDIDAQQAIHWYLVAVDKGEDKALMEIADIYSNKDLDLHNMKRAVTLYKQAIEKGTDGAVFRLAQLYYRENDNAEAIYWYRKAAEAGNEKAKSALQLLGVDFSSDDNL